MKYKVFIEYKVKDHAWDFFLTLLPEIKSFTKRHWNISGYQLYVGTDQKNLIVEEFFVNEMNAFSHIEMTRKENSEPLWDKFHNCIEGGSEKVNMWAFHKIEI